MLLVFADDSKNNKPQLDGMGQLLSIGGFIIDGEKCQNLNCEVENLCQRHGMPKNEEIKWSPNRNSWMFNNLIHGDREEFF